MVKSIHQEAVEWLPIFTKVNHDCSEPVPFDDVDYYAEQIHNLTNEEDYDRAVAVALELSKLS